MFIINIQIRIKRYELLRKFSESIRIQTRLHMKRVKLDIDRTGANSGCTT